MRLSFLPLILLVACTAPNHLGNPLTLPVRGLTSAVENASYGTRRARVSDFLAANASVLQSEARGAPGPGLAALYDTARIPARNRAAVIRDLAQISAAPPADWVERATVIVMVHSS